jgi:hypothetical protein
MTDSAADLILYHVRRYPELDVIDVYRLLHQAAFGVGSRIPNRKAAREWLDHEAELARQRPISPTGENVLAESVHPAGEIVRVYLQPYQAKGGSMAALLDAYMKSGEVPPGDPQVMSAWWSEFADMVAPGGALVGRFEPRVIALTGRMRVGEGWPASPHSPGYLAHYQPYYRVLTRDHAEVLFKQQGIE